MYQPQKFESHWQAYWDAQDIYATLEDPLKEKYYVLSMIPYPSAAGLHVGHVSSYAATDILARYNRMKGKDVLYPMGWDAFGLPAEQHALETGQHPMDITFKNIQNFKRQLKRLGLSYDWSREVTTCNGDYYKWTQWIFTLLWQKGLAYEAEALVNWCPALKTVLANDEVIDGRSERGDHPVVRVPMRQWMLKITAYADRLLEGLDSLDWPESLKDIQRNWIGKSSGTHVHFPLNPAPDQWRKDAKTVLSLPTSLTVFTTRPDTLAGVTFVTLSPEHPIVLSLLKANILDASFDKTGAFSGLTAQHPLTGDRLPVWIADYVLADYGTGAVMAVPDKDERDHVFAQKHHLPIFPLKEFPPQDIEEQKIKITKILEEKGLGTAVTTYRLRDWLFSRQRYWGEPIPILRDEKGAVARILKPNELPVTLPTVTHYAPADDGRSPLSRVEEFVNFQTPEGFKLFRETDTMPGSAASSWYFLRYCDPKNPDAPFSKEAAKRWMPVDIYIGGQEHAVGHILYARFWTMVLHDAGLCPVAEPFQKIVNQGMICNKGSKMSKSKGNGVNPEEIIDQYSSDALRLYVMFMGPLSQTKEWDEKGVVGAHRFLSRIYKHFINEDGLPRLQKTPNFPNPADPQHTQWLQCFHKTLEKVTEGIETLSLNTCVSRLMIFLNELEDHTCFEASILGDFLKILSPFAPHLAEELWHLCINPSLDPANCVSRMPWPTLLPQFVQDSLINLAVQINGKLRGQNQVSPRATQAEVVAACEKHPGLHEQLQRQKIKKIVYVPKRILNFVV